MKALGLPGWSGLIVPWLCFADITYIIFRQGGVGFSNGTLDGRIPLYAVTAPGLILAMAYHAQSVLKVIQQAGKCAREFHPRGLVHGTKSLMRH